MKIRYLHILGVFVLMFVAACSPTQDTAAQTALEDVTPDETDEGSESPADTELGTPAPGVDPDTVVETVVVSSDVKQFGMVAKQWEFQPDTIRVTEGETVRLSIESIDVTHGFAIPDFGVSERLVPGTTTEVEFVADKAGTYTFFCTVQCGAGHPNMRGKLVVE